MKLFVIYLNVIDPILERLHLSNLFVFKEDPIDIKFLSVANSRAIRDKDEFTLKRIDKVNKEFTSKNQMLDLIFSFTCLLVINILIIGSDNNPTISQKLNVFLYNNYEGWGYIAYYAYWITVSLFFLVSIMGLSPWESYRGFQKIHIPQNRDNKSA